MFDLLRDCPLLRQHVTQGKVAFGINHEMRDFAQNREKNLDFVICRASKNRAKKIGQTRVRNFRDLVEPYTIRLTQQEQADLVGLPDVPLAEPATVLAAIEAKACMTEFGKARPRLYDELNSSHLTVHGDTNGAIAAGLVIVNVASTFISPMRNLWTLGTHPTLVNKHQQPADAASVISKVHQLKRRSKPGDEGFDALGIVVIDCGNDGTPITLRKNAPAPASNDIYHYDQFISRAAHLYATRFSGL